MAYTEAELKKLTVAKLKEVAEDEFELATVGVKKPLLIERILEAQDEADEVDDDDELEDDDPIEVGDAEDDEEDDTSELDDEVDDELDDDEVDDEEPPAKPAKKAKAKKPAKDNDGEATLAAKQVAQLLNTDAKTLRQFFRSNASTTEAVGSGGRYEFLESDVPQIQKEFATWSEGKAKRGRPSADGEGAPKKRARKDKVRLESEIVPEAEELEELDDLEDDLEEFDEDELDED